MARSELEKLIMERKKELKLINSYGKNLSSDTVYYIHKSKIIGQTLKDEFFPGINVSSGFNFDLFYLDEYKWYKVEGKKLYDVLQGKEVEVLIENGNIISKSSTGKYVISVAPSDEMKFIKKKYNKYKFHNSAYTDITEESIEGLDKSIPTLIDVVDDCGEYNRIRFIRRMIRTKYKSDNTISVYATMKSLLEQLYIIKIIITKTEGTKTAPREVDVVSYYGIVPLKK